MYLHMFRAHKYCFTFMRQHTLNAHCVSFLAELALALAFNALGVSFLITNVSIALPFKTLVRVL